MELTRTDAVFSRTAMVLFFVQKIKILAKYEDQGAHTLLTRVGGAPPGCAPYLVGPLVALRCQLQLHILAFGEKKTEKKSSHFTIRSCHQALISLGRADLESVRGSGEGIHRRRHHQPSSITNFMMLTVVRE